MLCCYERAIVSSIQYLVLFGTQEILFVISVQVYTSCTVLRWFIIMNKWGHEKYTCQSVMFKATLARNALSHQMVKYDSSDFK